MFYLIKDGFVVDKSEKKFPVHNSLEWVEVNEDLTLNQKIKYENGNLEVVPNESDSIAYKTEKQNRLLSLKNKCLHDFLMGDASAKEKYQKTYDAIINCNTLQELKQIEMVNYNS